MRLMTDIEIVNISRQMQGDDNWKHYYKAWPTHEYPTSQPHHIVALPNTKKIQFIPL